MPDSALFRPCSAGLVVLVLAVGASVAGCAPSTETPATGEDTETPAPVPTDTAGFEPVPLPDPGIPGYQFPTPEATILGWVDDDDIGQMALHGWGLWTALTSETTETYDGQPLRVFETWATPGDIIAHMAAGQTTASLARVARDPRPLERPHQIGHAAQVSDAIGNGTTILGFVKYDPTAATHASNEELFSVAALDEILSAGNTDIPEFPETAVALKPVFQPLTDLVDDRYFLLPAWPGSPYEIENYQPVAGCWPEQKDGVTAGFTDGVINKGPECWQQCVWIDVQGGGGGDTAHGVDTTCDPSGSSRTADSTYPLDSFIHFTDEQGDPNVLLGMHVTSKEITRWTWQTFWWSYDPDDPKAPSSRAIAAARPSQLTGAPAHYAHCVGYSMLQPPQPDTGGSNTGESVYCYNPWLEALFDSSVLPASEPGTFDGQQVANNVGVQSNCMSCHAMASFASGNTPDLTGTLYTGDRYVDLQGPQFDGHLKVDFLWSIPGNAVGGGSGGN